MKILMTALISSFFCLSTLAQGSGEIYRAKLNKFIVDPQIKTIGEITHGHVEINLDHQEATLALYPAFRCPPEAFCAQLMPAPIFLTLPIVEIIEDASGSRTWIAEIENPANNSLERLEIQDNFGTEVTLLIETATETTRSYFSGESFVRLNQPRWHHAERRDVETWSALRQGRF